MMPTDKVRKFLSYYNINNCNVTVALSGGSDSVALTHILLSLKNEFKITINAAHLNHQLRGSESERDQNFVKAFCEKNNLHLFLERVDIKGKAKTEKKGIEETARKYRYLFLKSVATGHIATAHNKNDNAETVLMNITRGCGINGLCGINAKEEHIIRPILDLSKEEVMDYIKVNKLDFVTDSSNFNTDYSRNQIREKVIPMLKNINSDTVTAINRLSLISKSYEAYIEKEAKELIRLSKTKNGYSTEILLSADEVVRIKAYSIILKDFAKQNIEYQHLKSIDFLTVNQGKLNLPGDFFAEVKDDCLYFYIQAKKTDENLEFHFILEKGERNYNDLTVETKEISRKDFEKIQNVNNLAKYILIDYDKMTGEIIIRSRKAGDQFKKFGSNGSKRLQKLFIDQKIPLQKRSKIAVFSCEDKVIAVEGFGASDDFAVTKHTKRILLINIIRQNEE